MKNVKVLLTENVDNTGIVGDVVSVRPGFARNYLLPRGLAMEPTEEAVQRLAARRAQVELEMKERRAQLEALLEKLKNHEITLERSHNEQGILFGGVTQHDIAQVLRDEGHTVEDRMIRIGTVIKRLDSYHIPVVLASDLKTEIKLWVVSDKPKTELDAHDHEEAAPAEATVEVVEEKPRKKGKKAAEDKAEAPAKEPAKDDEKPKSKKKGKKAADAE